MRSISYTLIRVANGWKYNDEKALDCRDAIADLREQESKLYEQKFNNLKDEYDDILDQFDHTQKMLEGYIDLTEAQGYISSGVLLNTTAVIDRDYAYADNEGHIMAKITNDTNEGKTIEIESGKGFMQGIFVEYGITEDDDADGIRTGGFGSTTK